MKGEFYLSNNTNTPKKTLKELNLLDRFLFAEAMDDPENMKILLDIILGQNTDLKHPPQTEKEKRTDPENRMIRLDVYAIDSNDTIYNTEAQSTNTLNLPKRSRFYQGVIDSRLLEPGDIDFNKMNPLYIIIVTPFDLFKKGLYRYTFRMKCEEMSGIGLGDAATRIFLNTHGTHPELVSPELIEFLNYMEHTTDEVAASCESPRIKQMHERIQSIRNNEQIGVKYMQQWEEKILEQKENQEIGRREGRQEGLVAGQEKINLLISKLSSLGRTDDIIRSASDPAFQQQLLDEFHL